MTNPQPLLNWRSVGVLLLGIPILCLFLHTMSIWSVSTLCAIIDK
jgi:hypothetical protein